jgi:hypothetical protein
MEIGLMRKKGGGEGDAAGALMLPEVFVQKVESQQGGWGLPQGCRYERRTAPSQL